ncbi:MAG: membrane protein insertase YidC [Vicinamibacterales bacterium]
MEKRVFLAIFLSFVVLALYQMFLAPPPEPALVPPAASGPASAGTGGPAAPTGPAPTTPQAAPDTAAPASGRDAATPVPATAEGPQAAPLVADTSAREIVVETEYVRAVFDTRGAVLKSWQLKKFSQTQGQTAFLELVPPDLPDGYVKPFTLATTDASLTTTMAQALFKPSSDGPLTLGTAAGTLTFQYSDTSGLNVRKTFHFQPEDKPYLLNVEAAIDVKGTALPVTIRWGPALHDGHHPRGARQVPVRALLFHDGSAERIAASTLAETPHYEGDYAFVGVDEQYFMTTALPGGKRLSVDYEPISIPSPDPGETTPRTFIAYRLNLQPGMGALPFYLGPKDFDVLRAVDPQFVRAIDFGIFAWLVVPMLQALKWLHGYVGNYGWSIVLLTVLINLVMLPLRHRSMVSMRKMQALQPEIKAIQERYAKYKITDPERQKMNTEMMALYKQKGVNPASGCVPMLLTMPVLFAFYAMLQVAIELRHAPFFGWIHDLSTMDPFYVWPLLMGATMFWQQRITPTTADPTQAKIFMMMPVIFTFTFLWFPVGLVIYWLTNNLMAIGQQYVTNRLMGTPPARVLRASGPPKGGRAGPAGGRS